MSPDRRAYSWKKHFIGLYTSTIVYLVLPPSLPPVIPKLAEKMTDLPKFAARMLRGAAFQRLGGFS